MGTHQIGGENVCLWIFIVFFFMFMAFGDYSLVANWFCQMGLVASGVSNPKGATRDAETPKIRGEHIQS